MSRVLVTTGAMAAHVRPMMGLARALADEGHEVSWYTAAEFRPLVEASAARFVAAEADVDLAGILRRVGGRRGILALSRLVTEVFVRPVPAYVADLERVVAAVRPDVVVTDHSFRAALFLAERENIPCAVFSAGPLNLSSRDTPPFGFGLRPARSPIGRLRDRLLYRAMRDWLAREPQRELAAIRAGMGLPALDGYFIDWAAKVADRYLEGTVAEFEYPRGDLPAAVRFVGPMPAGPAGDWSPPPWWPEVDRARRAGRPVVFLTQGTIATDPANLLLPTARALAGEDVLVVATTSGVPVDSIVPPAARPANLRLAAFVPYAEILPRSDVIVTNGGYGGVQTALSHGVPLVVAGTTEDRKETNARVAWVGAGVSLRTDRPRPRAIRLAVRRVLSDPRYRANAVRLQAAYRNCPAPAAAVAAIAEIIPTHEFES